MPYIKQNRRKELTETHFDYIHPQTAGELNFLFTIIAQRYLALRGLNYQNLNDCIGALEGAKLELYRRVAIPYENEKIEENGDVKLI